ncbi:MAG: hypothetical protein NC114_06630 [Ruminococcus flavefaciens]|nr:hypothetical protein [Ruminococcus flavefaciens]
MPDAEGDELFQDRVDELKRDREFSRVVVCYNHGSPLSIERWINDHHTDHFETSNEVRVDPDNYLAKYSWRPQYPRKSSVLEEISEDEMILGKTGAAIIAKADIHLHNYNRYVDSIRDQYASVFKKAQNALASLNMRSPMMEERYEALNERCIKIPRVALETYILEHPDETAEEVIDVITSKHNKLKNRIDSFIQSVGSTVKQMVNMVVHGPQRKQILKQYYKVARELEKTPLNSFIEISLNEYNVDQANEPGYIRWIIGQAERDTKLFRIAWAIGAHGFDHIEGSWRVWPYPINTVEDFVVIVYQLLEHSDKYRKLTFHQYLPKVASNEFKRARYVSSLISKIRYEYSRYRVVEESGIKDAYIPFASLVDKAMDRNINDMVIGTFIPNTLRIIEDRGDNTLKMMEGLNRNYIASMTATLSGAKKTQRLDDETSPYDYEYIIRMIVPKISDCYYCRDGKNRIGYREFEITNGITDAGIALCMVLKVLKPYVGSMSVNANGTTYKFEDDVHEKLYHLIQSNDSDKPFIISGLIFWNTDDTSQFTRLLEREFDFL